MHSGVKITSIFFRTFSVASSGMDFVSELSRMTWRPDLKHWPLPSQVIRAPRQASYKAAQGTPLTVNMVSQVGASLSVAGGDFWGPI